MYNPKRDIWLPQTPQVLGGVVHGTMAIVPSRGVVPHVM